MRRSSTGSPWRALLGTAVLIIVLAAPALAGPMVKTFDRADNDFTFTYAGNSSIPAAASSTVFRRRDKVSFFAYVYPGAPAGSGLDGVLELTLATAKPVHYDGRFAFIVRNEDGSRAIRRTTTRSFTLRPTPGDRREVITFQFDLEPGRYLAFARFMAPKA